MNPPRRLKGARRYIASRAGEHGEALIDKLFEMAGMNEAAIGEHSIYTGPVKVRALVKLADIFFGREIRKVLSGKTQHEITIAAPAVAHDMSKLGDEALAAERRFWELKREEDAKAQKQLDRGQLERVDATDADFEEVSHDDEA